MDNSKVKTITLENPIQDGERTINELKIRKPTAKDLRGLPLGGGMTTDHMLELTSRCSGELPHVIDKIEADDLYVVFEAVGNFMQPGPRIGKTS